LENKRFYTRIIKENINKKCKLDLMKQDYSMKPKIHKNGGSQKMTEKKEKNHTTIQIPTALTKKIKKRIEEQNFVQSPHM
jgi:hypothetical protein